VATQGDLIINIYIMDPPCSPPRLRRRPPPPIIQDFKRPRTVGWNSNSFTIQAPQSSTLSMVISDINQMTSLERAIQNENNRQPVSMETQDECTPCNSVINDEISFQQDNSTPLEAIASLQQAIAAPLPDSVVGDDNTSITLQDAVAAGVAAADVANTDTPEDILENTSVNTFIDDMVNDAENRRISDAKEQASNLREIADASGFADDDDAATLAEEAYVDAVKAAVASYMGSTDHEIDPPGDKGVPCAKTIPKQTYKDCKTCGDGPSFGPGGKAVLNGAIPGVETEDFDIIGGELFHSGTNIPYNHARDDFGLEATEPFDIVNGERVWAGTNIPYEEYTSWDTPEEDEIDTSSVDAVNGDEFVSHEKAVERGTTQAEKATVPSTESSVFVNGVPIVNSRCRVNFSCD